MKYEQLEKWLIDSKKQAFDYSYKYVKLKNNKCIIGFLSSLSNDHSITYLIEGLLEFSSDDIQNDITIGNLSVVDDLEVAKTAILSGLSVVCVEGIEDFIILETRSYPSRSISEPETEKSIRASKDGFIEGFLTNIALIRRRIRDENLKIKYYQFGKRTKTDIALIYIEDIVEQDILKKIVERFDEISKETNIINERQLAELIFNSKFNPYPLVRYSERVDIVSIHLLQGKFVTIIDNSPTVIILPTTFFEQCKQIEEYTLTPLVGTMVRLIRYLGILLSLYLLPIWLIIIAFGKYNPSFLYLPIIDSVFNYGIKILVCDFAVELLRLSFIHSPSMLSSVIGLVAAFLIGQMAIDFNFFTPEIILYVAIANIGNFVTPSYELAMANKISRIFMIIGTTVFGYFGGIFTIVLHFILIVRTKSFTYHFLFPLIPFNKEELFRYFFRFKGLETRKKKIKD